MNHKKIIVVVGASRGIGKATVEKFASNPDYTVYALSRNTKGMEQFSHLPNVTCFGFDLETSNVREQAEKIFSGIELGASAEIYTQKIPIMAIIKSNNVFFNVIGELYDNIPIDIIC